MKIPLISKGKDVPKHLAISTTRIKEWSEKKNKPLIDAVSLSYKKIYELIENQTKKDIPIISILLTTKTEEEISGLNEFLQKLTKEELINEKKIRVHVLGEWYGLDSDLTDSIKLITEETKDYDNYFLNLLVNYDGQKEILASLKLMIKKYEAEKLDIHDLSPEMVKENLASSYFLPPDLIIENGGRYSGMLLWDSKGSVIYFTDKYWLDFDKSDLEDALKFYDKNKKI